MAGFVELYEAVVSENTCTVERLVREGTDVNCRDSMKRTVLHHAAEQGKKQMIECLARIGAHINATDIQRMTPLHCALSSQHIETRHYFDLMSGGRPSQSELEFNLHVIRSTEKEKVELLDCLVKLGADINATFDYGVTSLHEAIRIKNTQAVRVLAQLGLAATNTPTAIGYTALSWAVRQREMAVMKRLVKLGADVNASFREALALHYAVELGQVDIVEILLQHGADVNAIQRINISPVIYGALLEATDLELFECLAQLGADFNLKCTFSDAVHEAVRLPETDILKYLVEYRGNIQSKKKIVTPLVIAISKCQYEKVIFLVKCGADIDARYHYSVFPLAEAVKRGNVEMVEMLVKRGVNPDIRSCSEGFTALHHAITLGRQGTKMLEMLLRLGGDMNITCDNVLVLHDAVARGDINMVNMLGNLGADMNITRTYGLSLIGWALDYATLDVIIETINIILQAGADLNSGSEYDVMALHDAVRLSSIEMVETLIHHGADINMAKIMNFKPLHRATALSMTDIVKYLANQGANMDTKCEIGITPIHDAIRRGNVKMVECLLNFGPNLCIGRSDGQTALNIAVAENDSGMFKCLVEAGADINTSYTTGISVLHDVVHIASEEMASALVSFMRTHPSNEPCSMSMVSLLHDSIMVGNSDITETLLTLGVDTDCTQNIPIIYVTSHLDERKYVNVIELVRNIVDGIQLDQHPTKTTSQVGHIDLTRSLIVAGGNVKTRDYLGKIPLDYLPLASSVDYHVLYETTSTEQVVKQVGDNFKHGVCCQSMEHLLCTQGIGDVQFIYSPKSRDIGRLVRMQLRMILDRCKKFSKAKLVGCGSAAEGTKVGLPDEMDFLIELGLSSAEVENIKDAGYGYIHYCDVNEKTDPLKKGSKIFHNSYVYQFINVINQVVFPPLNGNLLVIPYDTNYIIKDSNRRATSPLRLQWVDEHSKFLVYVDTVPCLHVDHWPDDAIFETWLMDHESLSRQGYLMVPKPPHADSELAKRYTEMQLQAMWKRSFAHLEAYHMQRLENRVKDVYVLAKCLRNPDVCRIMITDEGSLPRNVDKYITSYFLKMVFFQNIEDFLRSDLSLGEMVCKVYDDLEIGLSKEYIPLFFMPKMV